MSEPLFNERPLPQLPPAMPWWVLPSLGAMVLVIFYSGLVASFLWGNETQQTTMLTAAVTLATGMAAYYWGSSNGSQKKDEAMARITMNAAGGNPEIKP